MCGIIGKGDVAPLLEIDIASEFRYRAPDIPMGGLALFISQCGKTADTLAALRHTRPEATYRRRRQSPGKHDVARGRCRPAGARRAGNRRRLDQRVHHHLVVLACFAIELGTD